LAPVCGDSASVGGCVFFVFSHIEILPEFFRDIYHSEAVIKRWGLFGAFHNQGRRH